jgi:hypothetical protein
MPPEKMLIASWVDTTSGGIPLFASQEQSRRIGYMAQNSRRFRTSLIAGNRDFIED